MQFFMLFPDQRYASYICPDPDVEAVLYDTTPPRGAAEWEPPHLIEYLGDPPGRPRRQGGYHAACSAQFFSEEAIEVLSEFLRPAGIWLPVSVEGRRESFFRFWLTHRVDCLDWDQSDLRGQRRSRFPWSGNSTGVIRRPVFREQAWDGSDIFGVPDNPAMECFVSERFVDACITAKIRGAEFRRWYFDESPIVV